MASTVEKTVEVGCPVSTVSNQWTQFEEFPEFMDGVEEVRQVDDSHLHWVANVGGRRKEWDAEIVEQTPTAASPGGRRPAPTTRGRSTSSRWTVAGPG